MAETTGFLTDEQRKLMKQASLNREGSTELLSPRAAAKHHERRSHSGKNGRPKKGGSGGKGTWGSVMEDGSQFHVERNDPNYDSGEEPYQLRGAQVAQSLDLYKEKVVYIVEEYFTTGNVEEAATDLRDLGSPSYHHYFVKRLISMAMDRHDREKEMASVLLSALYADVIEPDQLAKGFMKLLESVDDLALDIPDATDILALFLARAVVDDIIPPAFLSKAQKSLPESSKGQEVLQNTEKSYLSAPLHAEVVERRWGGSTQTTVEEVKRKISQLLKEYEESGDIAEACRCIRELNVPFFYHEVVKKALTLAIEKRSAEDRIMSLLKECADEGLISSNQTSKGFSRVFDALDDLSLDVPQARDILEDLVSRGMSEGWLSESFVKPECVSSNGKLDETYNGMSFMYRVVKPELFPGHRALLLAERDRKKRLGILTRKVRPFAENQCPRRRAQPSHLLQNESGTMVAFVRAVPQIPARNLALLKSLESRKETDTFVLDTSVACLFKNLNLEDSQKTPDREVFLKFLKTVRLAAPPVAWKEYVSFGMSSAIPFSKMSNEDLQKAQQVVDSLISLFRRSPKARWLAMKERHKARVKDYMFVVQSAMLYPKTTILTNDSDYGIFEVMKDDIEDLMYRNFNKYSLSLSRVTAVNVGYDLGLDVRCSHRRGRFLNPKAEERRCENKSKSK